MASAINHPEHEEAKLFQPTLWWWASLHFTTATEQHQKQQTNINYVCQYSLVVEQLLLSKA
jgi:hypothetical protein